MDRYALRVLFRMAGGEEWREKLNWNTDAELSTWHGVTVNDQGRVVKLDLGNNNLRGAMCLTFRKNKSPESGLFIKWHVLQHGAVLYSAVNPSPRGAIESRFHHVC